ncbi:hypothetical protein fh0823_27850 (plasmid) [Francisella halioticida]|uniref:DUF4145 domain-containing protein n=1 Tax=Francisella halioticida TaxID=549298 RepID=UPI001AF2C0AE|nr:DUF4145 domain-containing protein [Francisella halioticida]BCD92648.1 hypothetical protein fh0823_27850 [Francisella halioticida]
MNNYVIPEFRKESFNCPYCNAFSHMKWLIVTYETTNTKLDNLEVSECSCCKEHAVWYQKYIRTSYNMIVPDYAGAPPPSFDMPDDVKVDYLEAASVYSKSPRASAALLRLALQKLCIHLGEKGKNINDDIRRLSEKKILSPIIVKIADIVRITGNNAVHPGELSDDDFDYVSAKLFKLINIIIEKAITDPKEYQEFYNLMPEGSRKAAEQKDLDNKSRKAT